MRKYTKEHEWVEISDNGTATIGITPHAEDQLGDVVFVGLPNVGDVLEMDAEACVLESVKTASEVYAPITCTVTEINEQVLENPKLINADPQGDGWLFRATPTDPEHLNTLMNETQYAEFIKI